MTTTEFVEYYQKWVGTIQVSNRKIYRVEKVYEKDDEIFITMKELLTGRTDVEYTTVSYRDFQLNFSVAK